MVHDNLLMSFRSLVDGCLMGRQVRDMRERQEVWIAKPSITNQGIGVHIFDSVASLREALEQQPDLREWVLQRRDVVCGITPPCTH